MNEKNLLIEDFYDPLFRSAFQSYFNELGMHVKEWDALFQEMNHDGGNKAYIRLTENNEVIGFIQFKLIQLTNWFFEERLGFVREFWVSSGYRNGGHGSALLKLTESYFLDNHIYKSILTTDTAEKFYIDRGYQKDISYYAKNNDFVYTKEMRREQSDDKERI